MIGFNERLHVATWDFTEDMKYEYLVGVIDYRLNITATSQPRSGTSGTKKVG